MAGKARDLKGQRFGRLFVIDRHIDLTKKSAYWNVLCDCGTIKYVRGSQLTSGSTISCGCYAKDNPPNTKHGMTNSFEFASWTAMRKRCYYKKHKAYAQYGGRGIVVCDRWQDFRNFYEDMGPCPYPKGSIERIDCDGNYTPANCIWLPKRLQSANRRVVLKSRGRHSMMKREIEGLYELIGSLYKTLSGVLTHKPDCATNSAPAHLPKPCDCRRE